jgi:predicted DNA-binding transcriptional regulator AlpA
MSEPDIPAYISRKRAARQLDMSRDTFDNYVRKGVLPPPKRRGKLTRWKWSEISAVLDDGNFSVIQSAEDPYDRGVERAKAPMLELPPHVSGRRQRA